MKRVIGVLGVMLVLWMGSEGFADLGDTDSDLVYTPVTPCRIIDTREPGAGGPIAGGATRNFMVAGTTGFDSQGGNTGGCGIPENATSVMINFIAANPSTGGHLRAWPYGGSMPNASIVNFGPGLNIANGLIQPICNPAMTTCTFDLTIYAASPVQVVADVTGYFRYPRSPSYRTTFYGNIPAQGSPAVVLATLTYTPLSSGTVYARSRGYCNMGTGATGNEIHISAGTSESEAFNPGTNPVANWGVLRIAVGIPAAMMWSSDRAVSVTEGVPISINLYGRHLYGNWSDLCSGTFSIDKRF